MRICIHMGTDGMAMGGWNGMDWVGRKTGKHIYGIMIFYVLVSELGFRLSLSPFNSTYLYDYRYSPLD